MIQTDIKRQILCDSTCMRNLEYPDSQIQKVLCCICKARIQSLGPHWKEKRHYDFIDTESQNRCARPERRRQLGFYLTSTECLSRIMKMVMDNGRSCTTFWIWLMSLTIVYPKMVKVTTFYVRDIYHISKKKKKHGKSEMGILLFCLSFANLWISISEEHQ
jgi:hypothetical protein